MDPNFFGVEAGSISQDQLLKALEAGGGTDSDLFTGGRALQPESIETTMINAMKAQREDFKLGNMIKKTPVYSVVHQFNRRLDVGNFEFLSVPEGGGSVTNDQTIERVTQSIKYLQDRRSVTDQMAVVRGFEDAYESEKVAGTINILRALEYLLFHGNSSVVEDQFDGIIRQIEMAKDANIFDVRGKTIGNVGESIITEPVRMIFEAGGDANKLFMPPVLAQGVQDLVRDRIRFGTSGSSTMSLVVDQYPTAYGSTVHFGKTEGADKFFRSKGIVAATGDVNNRPEAPASVTASPTADPRSRFTSTNAGNYHYTVHAINGYGISDGTKIAGATAVSAGHKVTLTIKPSVSGKETGYIICRSAKDGTEVMEMIRIGRNKSGDTVFEDLNKDLPGTAEMVIFTEAKLQNIVEWFQLMPLRTRPLYETNRAEKPFFVQLFGSLGVKVPTFCALVKNIAYPGGLVY